MRVSHTPADTDGLPTNAVAELVDCSYRQLHRWISQGIISGEPLEAGQGTRILFDEDDVEAAYVAARLAELGAGSEHILGALNARRNYLRMGGAPTAILFVYPSEPKLVSVAVQVVRRGQAAPIEPCWSLPLVSIDDIYTEQASRAALIASFQQA